MESILQRITNLFRRRSTSSAPPDRPIEPPVSTRPETSLISTEVLFLDAKEQAIQDRHDQTMQFYDEAIEKALAMEDSPEKLRYILDAIQKGNALVQQDEALTTADELTARYQAGTLDEEQYRQAMDATLDRFNKHG